MQVIQLETKIAAPPERCFLLSLSIDLHIQSTATTGERAIAGVTHGVIGPNETVTWEGRHFGFMLQHQSRISTYEKSHHFQDVVVRGMFRSFTHDHYFEQTSDDGTLMRDRLQFSAPLWTLRWPTEMLVLKPYLTRFLIARNQAIRQVAESSTGEWRKFL